MTDIQLDVQGFEEISRGLDVGGDTVRDGLSNILNESGRLLSKSIRDETGQNAQSRVFFTSGEMRLEAATGSRTGRAARGSARTMVEKAFGSQQKPGMASQSILKKSLPAIRRMVEREIGGLGRRVLTA